MTVIPHTNTPLVTDYLSEQVQAVNLASAPCKPAAALNVGQADPLPARAPGRGVQGWMPWLRVVAS
jgi:hypothetical protein